MPRYAIRDLRELKLGIESTSIVTAADCPRRVMMISVVTSFLSALLVLESFLDPLIVVHVSRGMDISIGIH